MEFKELLTGCCNRKSPTKGQALWRFALCASPFARLRLCGKVLLVLSLGIAAAAQQRQALAPADILRVATVADAQISPTGEWVVYSVSTVEGDATRSTLWLAKVALEGRPGTRTPPSETRTDFDQMGQPPTRLLPPGGYGANPRWSPDGKSIAFLANHEAQDGIWIVTLDRRQPRFIVSLQETNFFITYAGESFAWSPDSKMIAYISAGEESASVEVESKDDPRVIERMQYKSRTSFSDRLRTHVYFTFVDNPEARQLTTGLYYDHALAFSPRGDEVAFLSNHEPDPDANNNSDIFAVDLHGQVRQITITKGCEYEPVWSPDGKWIAYTATKRDVTTIDSVAEDTHVWVISAAGGAGRELTDEQDRRARSPKWDRDSRSIFFLAGDRGYSTIFRVNVDGKRVNRFSLFVLYGEIGGAFDIQDSKLRLESGLAMGLASPFQITSFSLGNRPVTLGRPGDFSVEYTTPLAFTIGTALRPAEVWSGLGSSMPLRRLSAHTDGAIRSSILVEPEEVDFKSFDGTQIQGWLMRPLGLREDRKYPLIVSIHGGPHGMSGWTFNPSFQVYAARGYAVLYLNPRGSSGYGQRFSDGTLNEWGGGDYRDLMGAVDEVLHKYSWLDAERLGVTGGSYGGFMTNWIVSQTPRFKAAVAVASVSNLISFYSTSLYQDLIHAEFGGFPWDNYDLLWQWSPLRYARQVQTPTLFIHGELDNDVHITQAEEMYMALKRRGVETVFVRYPREGHGLREPKHRVDALERTIAWFDRYLK